VNLNRAIDLYIGELARRGRTQDTQRTYQRHLFAFADFIGEKSLAAIDRNDCRRFLDRWRGSAANTQNIVISAMRGLFDFLVEEDELVVSPMARIPRRPRKRAEDLAVVTVSAEDVERMFDHCEDWQELLCLAVLAYSGARRRAVSQLRWRDVDLTKATVRFYEKGGKVAVKPVPDELLAILRAAVQSGEVEVAEDAYVVPNRRKASVRRSERSSKVIWETVKRVAGRAGVHAHVHSIRAAFAVRFLETHPGDLEALQPLMGHNRLETTAVYLRRLNRVKAMERVRDLSWRSVFPPEAVEAHTGFEPVPPP
jgi:site-specific recombinase XerD